jgi:ferric-dicitrate binding protein FerR (iron transport regulator)
MEKSNTYFIELITSHLSGETTPEQAAELMQWTKSSAENAQLYEAYAATWNAINHQKIEDQIALDEEWASFQEMIPEVEPSPIKEPIIRSFNVSRMLRIAALFLLLAVPTFFLVRYMVSPGMEHYTAQNGISEKILPDGTVVTLNAGSTIDYPSRFSGKTRSIQLQGEGYFEVKHDEDHPFIISSRNARIEVLGTTFNVNTTSQTGTTDVILASGSVAVYTSEEPNRRVLLKPGEKARIDVNGNILKSENEDPNYIAWKTRRLVFNEEPLSEIIRILNKVYHADVRLKGNQLDACTVTATFDNQPLESVLRVLEATLDLQVTHSGSTVELSGNGCK